MTQSQKEQIDTLREQGNGYKRIRVVLLSKASMMSRFVFQSAVIRFRVMKSSVLSQEAEVFPFTGQTVSIF